MGRRALLTPRKLEFGITRRGRGRVRTRNTYRRALLVPAQIETRKTYWRGFARDLCRRATRSGSIAAGGWVGGVFIARV